MSRSLPAASLIEACLTHKRYRSSSGYLCCKHEHSYGDMKESDPADLPDAIVLISELLNMFYIYFAW